MFPDLKSFRQLLTSTRAGEWLYVETEGYGTRDVFKTTNGYFDKFCLCLKDVFTGCTLTQKTQRAVNQVMASCCNEVNQNSLQAELFRHANSIANWNSCIESIDRNRIKLVWNNDLTVVKTIDSLSECLKSSFFLPCLEKVRQLVALIPQGCFNQEKIAELFQKTVVAFEELRSVDSSTYLERSVCWIKVIQTLRDIKFCLRNERPFDEGRFDSLDLLPWKYCMSPWSIQPSSCFIDTPGHCQKRIDSLDFDFDNGKIEVPEPSTKPEQLVEEYAKMLFSFVEAQPASQRRPIKINFTEPNAYSLSKEKLETASKVLDPLIRKTMTLLENHPEYFPHQASLYEEGTHIPNADKQKDKTRKCLSHLTGHPVGRVCDLKGIHAVPLRPLRQGIKQTINRLRQEKFTFSFMSQFRSQTHVVNPLHDIDLNKAVSFSKEAAIARELQAFGKGFDFTVSFQGKDYGCHKEVLCGAFSYLESRMSGNFAPEEEVNKLNLDKILPSTQLPVDFGKWVLDALVTYAYTGEHPNLTEDISMQTKQAYQAYLTYVDFLNPGHAVL